MISDRVWPERAFSDQGEHFRNYKHAKQAVEVH